VPKLDPSSREFRDAGHRLIDWIADYLDGVDRYDVLSRVTPGEIAARFPDRPSEEGRPYDALIADFESKIVPGITHWNHPAFFAYFSITGSQAGILAELLTAALNANGMLWKTSPSLTELESVTLEWLRASLGLPGGLFGIINDTASINSFLALAAGSILYVVIELLAVARATGFKVLITWAIMTGLALGFVTDAIVSAAGA